MSTVRIGSSPKEQNTNKFWGLKAGETKDVVILHDVSDIVSAEQVALWDFNPALIWTCTDVGDPSRDIGAKPSYRAYVPVLVDIDGNKVIKIWSCTRTVHSQLHDISEALGESLVGLIVKVKRTGEGLTTKYSVTNTGRRAKNMPEADEIPSSQDVIDMLDVKDRAGIIDYITKQTGGTYEQFVAKFRGQSASSDNSVGSSRKPGVVTTEDF